jgi:outer membrane protein TolC
MPNNSMSASSGDYTLADIYRIQIESGDLENSIALLENRYKTIAAQFNTYLNRPVGSAVYINENITADTLGIQLMVISDSTLKNNPILGMIGYEKQSIEARERMVRRMGFPMVGLGLNYSFINKTEGGMATPDMNGKDMMMPMITLTLPVYRKKYNAMKTEAQLLQTASSENYKASSNALQAEYFQAVQLYQDAQRRVKLYENQYNLASKSLDLMLRNFTVSSAGLTDVLRIRQQTLDYEYKQVEAIADYNTAIAWLRRLVNYNIEL